MKVLITGPPRCGKSTLISKLIDYYRKKNYIIRGFLTPEVRKKGGRIGFDIVDIYSGEKARLARSGDYKTRYEVGKYMVFLEEFEEVITNMNLNKGDTSDLIFIDEIGKMELFSQKFQDILRNLFRSNIPIIATIGLKISHPIKEFIINLPEVELFHLNRQNFDKIFEEIISFMY